MTHLFIFNCLFEYLNYKCNIYAFLLKYLIFYIICVPSFSLKWLIGNMNLKNRKICQKNRNPQTVLYIYVFSTKSKLFYILVGNSK
jgi:hypothetical protein